MKRVSKQIVCKPPYTHKFPEQRNHRLHQYRSKKWNTSFWDLAYINGLHVLSPLMPFLIFIVTVLSVVALTFVFCLEDSPNHHDNIARMAARFSRQPYIQDYEGLRKQRENMLRHYGYSESMGSVEKRSLLSLSEFRELYDAKWPVIVTDIIPFWEAYRTWNKEFFLTHYGSQNVLMRTVKGRLNESVAQVKPLSDFVRLLDQTTDPTSWVYLEDELFLIQNPRLRAFVGSNYLLDENMFALFPPEIRPWDSMLLWGGRHSRSFLHMDPYNWTAVNAVLWGAKHWKLYPPGQDQFLYIVPDLKCGFPLECRKYNSEVDAFDVDIERYPLFRRASHLEVVQTRGEVIVIPSGWFHQAYNINECLSVSMQLMSPSNHLAVLEEIVKGGNLHRDKLPPLFDSMGPVEQVKLFMSLIPKETLQSGEDTTKKVLKQKADVIV